MQDTLLVTAGTAFLAPMAIDSFGISEVFDVRRRRLPVPALRVALIVAMACGTYSSLKTAYQVGAANFSDPWAQKDEPTWRFDVARRIIKQPT